MGHDDLGRKVSHAPRPGEAGELDTAQAPLEWTHLQDQQGEALEDLGVLRGSRRHGQRRRAWERRSRAGG
jgi:hypothetical protein